MMPVVPAPLSECTTVGVPSVWPERRPLLAIARHAFALKVVEMRRERRAAVAVPNRARLDDGDASEGLPVGWLVRWPIGRGRRCWRAGC
jgi:hypothetical protein